MDTLAPDTAAARTTQAAEGLPRWRWTIEEVVRLSELGVFAKEDRFELIGGEIVPMSPPGPLHQSLAERLTDVWSDLGLRHLRIRNEPQLELAPSTYTLPDILVWPRSISITSLRGPDALLLVEVADTSIKKDLGAKRLLYAAHGVRDYWVVSATTRMTTVHRAPANGDYQSVTEIAATTPLTPLLAPDLAVTLAAL